MRYFLNAPASMATNRGACRSETAGTATLMTFSGTSAENVGVSSDSKNAVRKIRLVHRFIVAPGLIRLSPDYSKPEKKSSWIRHPSSLELIATKSLSRSPARAGDETHKVSNKIEFFLFETSPEHSAIGGMLVLRTGSRTRSGPAQNFSQEGKRMIMLRNTLAFAISIAFTLIVLGARSWAHSRLTFSHLA